MFLYDKPSYVRALTNSRMTLRKETEPLSGLNKQITKVARSSRIMDGNKLHNTFKINQKGGLEDYFEVHSFNRDRT